MADMQDNKPGPYTQSSTQAKSRKSLCQTPLESAWCRMELPSHQLHLPLFSRHKLYLSLPTRTSQHLPLRRRPSSYLHCPASLRYPGLFSSSRQPSSRKPKLSDSIGWSASGEMKSRHDEVKARHGYATGMATTSGWTLVQCICRNRIQQGRTLKDGGRTKKMAAKGDFGRNSDVRRSASLRYPSSLQAEHQRRIASRQRVHTTARTLTMTCLPSCTPPRMEGICDLPTC